MPKLGSKRTKPPATAWRDSPEGIASYRAVRAEAQAKADEIGFDYGLEANDLFKSWRYFMLPQKQNRYGHETQCEVVHPTDLARTRPGHGPCATRPPSPVGPDHHGGPWVGAEAAREANRVWDREWSLDRGFDPMRATLRGAK